MSMSMVMIRPFGIVDPVFNTISLAAARLKDFFFLKEILVTRNKIIYTLYICSVVLCVDCRSLRIQYFIEFCICVLY